MAQMVERRDILPILIQIAEEDSATEARNKCIATLTLLAESIENAIPLIRSGALVPLMSILHNAGPDPSQWKDHGASWCMGFLMNLCQSDEAVPLLREAGVMDLLIPLVALNHYQSLKAAIAVIFLCEYDEYDATYDLFRKTETVIPKIVSLLQNTLVGRGGHGYKYGVFTLRSSVGCITRLAYGPDFMKDCIAIRPVYECLIQVLSDFCVNGGKTGTIVGGGREDYFLASLAVRALHSLTGYLIPVPGRNVLPFDSLVENSLLAVLSNFESCCHVDLTCEDKEMAREICVMISGYEIRRCMTEDELDGAAQQETGMRRAMHAVMSCCGVPTSFKNVASDASMRNAVAVVQSIPGLNHSEMEVIQINASDHVDGQQAVRTFLLEDKHGRKFVVPLDPSGGRSFNDNRVWCYRRGRYCEPGEVPDPNYHWTRELQMSNVAALQDYQNCWS